MAEDNKMIPIISTLESLKNLHAGNRAIIIGKGPSLDTIDHGPLWREALLGNGNVIFCLNESVRKFESLNLPVRPYVVQQDCNAALGDRCVPANGTHFMNCWQERWTGMKWQKKKVKKSEWNERAVLYDPEAFGFNIAELSAVAALYLAKFMGIQAVTFCCFDAMAEGSCEYAQCIDKLGGPKNADVGDPGRHRTQGIYILKVAREMFERVDMMHPKA